MASRRMSGTNAGRGTAGAEIKRLPPGQHGLPREQVLRSQRGRLRRAMVTAVAENGYAKTKIRDLARLAGVSPNAVYDLYASKEACFLATHDVIAEAAIERVASAAAAAGEDWRERLHAGFEAFVEMVIAEPGAATLAIVETQTVGGRALEHQQLALARHERIIREGLAGAPHGTAVSDTTIKAIVAGTRTIVYRHLVAGRPERLRTLVEPIFDWVLSYHTAAGAFLPPTPPSDGSDSTLRAPAALPSSMCQGSEELRKAGEDVRFAPRERIMAAVAAVVCQHGYAGLSMPAITSYAAVSNQTFYELFCNKQDAFLACYDRVNRRALGAMLASFQAAEDWPAAIRASLRALLGMVAAKPELARLALFEVLAAGPAARRKAQGWMEAFSAILDAGFALSESPPPGIVRALIAGGAFGVVQHHTLTDRGARLAELEPHLTYLALTPFIGAERAAEVATRRPR